MAKGIVVGISGEIASGKSTVCKYLAECYGFELLRYRTLLSRMLSERGENISRSTLQRLGLELGKNIGYDGITRLLLGNTKPDMNYVLDGVRHLAAFEYLRRRYSNRFVLVYRDTNVRLRWHMYNERLPLKDRLNICRFYDINRAPVESEISMLKSKADLVLHFERDISQLYAQIDSFMIIRFGLTSVCGENELY